MKPKGVHIGCNILHKDYYTIFFRGMSRILSWIKRIEE